MVWLAVVLLPVHHSGQRWLDRTQQPFSLGHVESAAGQAECLNLRISIRTKNLLWILSAHSSTLGLRVLQWDNLSNSLLSFDYDGQLTHNEHSEILRLKTQSLSFRWKSSDTRWNDIIWVSAFRLLLLKLTSATIWQLKGPTIKLISIHYFHSQSPPESSPRAHQSGCFYLNKFVSNLADVPPQTQLIFFFRISAKRKF